MSVDPVTADGNTGGNFNRYWYANNNPYRFTDPDGRQSRRTDNYCANKAYQCSETGGGGAGPSESTVPSPPMAGAASAPAPQKTFGEKLGNLAEDSLDTLLDKVLPAIPLEGQAIAFGKFVGASVFAARLQGGRAINLPGWSKLTVDMTHIAERHITGGAFTEGRTVFTGLNQRGVMAAINQAYGSAAIVMRQGDRVLLSGVTKTGMTVEMWLNKATKMIETAYPVVGR